VKTDKRKMMKETENLTLSIVIPVYHSAKILPELVKQLSEVLPDITKQFEVILVNDGSRDDTWQVIQKLAKQHDWLRGICMMRNYGQHNALLCGIRTAKNEIVVTMDDDLQHPPEEIPKLLAKLSEGYDVVYGKPEKEQHGILRDILSILTKSVLASAMGVSNIKDISAFRAFRTELRSASANFQSPQLLLDVLLSWGTTRFGSVKVKHQPRFAGKSNYNFKRLVNQMLLILTGFSVLPLRVASIAGFGFTIFGMAIFVYAVINYFFRGSIPGFTFLASIVAVFSGVQMFALGIIGEYLGRIFSRSMERPTYTVKETIGD
jgi:glycosyltransferase involved in cell wall biosynthesis